MANNPELERIVAILVADKQSCIYDIAVVVLIWFADDVFRAN